MSTAKALTKPRVLVIGGGPIGLEASALLVAKGFAVTVAESGPAVAASVRDWGHVRLFSSNELNCSPWGLKACATVAGAAAIDPMAWPTGAEFASTYLEPLCQHLHDSGDCDVLVNTKVISVSKGGVLKNEAVVAVGEKQRSDAPFQVLLSHPAAADGEDEHESLLTGVSAVFDASGSYGHGNHVGRGGAPALGERALRARNAAAANTGAPRSAWFDSLPDVNGKDRGSFVPARQPATSTTAVALVGGGYSAATTLLSLIELAKAEPALQLKVEWLLRRKPGAAPYARLPDDPLPSRAALVDAANGVADGTAASLPPNLAVTVHRGVVLEATESSASGGVAIRGERSGTSSGVVEALDVRADVLISHAGFRPQTELTRELQVHHCYASEGPMKLAASLLAARVAASSSGDGAAAGDCLAQAKPGPDLLRTPEPRFFVVGAKSYGRNSAFLLTLGHAQVEAVVGILVEELFGAASPVEVA